MEKSLEENSKMTSTLDFLTKENETLKSMLKDASTKLSEAEEKLSTYENFIHESEFEKVATVLADVKRISEAYGTLDVVEKKLESAKITESALEKLGTVEEIAESAELLEAYMKLGTPVEINDSAVILERYMNHGTVEEVAEAVTLLESFTNLGTVEMMKESLQAKSALERLGYSLESIDQVIAEKEQQVKESMIDSLVNNFAITRESADSTLDMFAGSVDDAAKYLESLNVKKASLVGKQVKKVNESKEKKSKTFRTFLNKF